MVRVLLATLILVLAGCGDPCRLPRGHPRPVQEIEPRLERPRDIIPKEDRQYLTVGPGCWRVTAYCPCRVCCGPGARGITASGTRADHRLIAAPRGVPFGTVMTIPGYGRAKVEDRGGAIRGRRLDVLFPTHRKALEWGVRYLAEV